jgi:ribosomal protein S18 acetylase RimI-like enzyme
MSISRRFKLRDAEHADYHLVEKLYLDTMQPLLSELDAWDRDEFRERIRQSFNPDETRIVVLDGRDIGFFHVIETDADIKIAQLHLVDGYRGQGIGTKLILELISRAKRFGKTVSLSAPRNNPAIALYERLGFRTQRDDGDPIIDMVRPPESAT